MVCGLPGLLLFGLAWYFLVEGVGLWLFQLLWQVALGGCIWGILYCGCFCFRGLCMLLWLPVGFGFGVCSLLDCLYSACLIGFLVSGVAVCYSFAFMVVWLFVAWLPRVCVLAAVVRCVVWVGCFNCFVLLLLSGLRGLVCCGLRY